VGPDALQTANLPKHQEM